MATKPTPKPRKTQPIVPGQIQFSVRQAAQMLGISPAFCWELVASGQLRSRKRRARRLIHRDELERFSKIPEWEGRNGDGKIS